ncbi:MULTISPECIES: pirin family protein [Acinetobacter]|jgi:redox-sensitive bicupin YhaK (pirin superfamily)|uniref:Pirin family protein n=1 Tax=Acinetobacter bereziniae TaxID=106648 RepID=A0A8B5SEN5_ACIBZ|nr:MULTISPECIES: pirin family protein [Acinetobacter]MEC8122898.1 pirin family protein [Pseudomonadota bacterium]ATZ65492.1 quercetin 2,3-dioxygenase [Acinetobacter bereziniae]ELW83971.1 pirin family protein [Acinetobacter sp. WC-743]MBI0394856.1 pirin family protein [Acinetobacter bereziniae]MBJ8425405.1 pirin family protein [Acinetobacter bereziniae]
MTNTNYTEISNSDDCEKYVNQFIQDFPIRSAEIGRGTVIKRALPSRQKRMIGAWCFLDHAGPVTFPQGDGLDVGPHPHIGLQTFTWMIEGTMMHTDSIGSKQLIRPKQVNLMTAGYGISHTEVAPDTETRMHAAQLWIALPDDKINMAPQFDHYPVLPIVEKDNIEFTVLVGEFMDTVSPVQVHTELLGIDFFAKEQTKTRIPLNPKFEYGFMALEGDAIVNGHDLNSDNMVVLEPGISQIEVELPKGSRLLLIGGEPFESPILLWWNLVGRTQEELKTATEQWINQDARFGTIPDYDGPRLEAPAFPDKMRPSK